jgi:hypothetical protein
MSRWNKQQDTGWARVNKNILGEREPARGHEEHIREVLQEDGPLSMYRTIVL